MIEQLLSPASWGSPLGVGVFMICLGIFFFFTGIGNRKEDALADMIQKDLRAEKASKKK